MLTVEGEALYKKAVYILQYCDELQADCSSTLRVRPPVHIGIPPMLSTVFFPELLEAFQAEHPEIPLYLKNMVPSAPVVWCRMIHLILHLSTWNSTTSTSLITLFSPMIRSYFA